MPQKMKRILLTLTLTLIFSITMASFGIAYAGGVRGPGLIGVCFFFTFGVIVVLAQLVPAAILLSTLVGTVFSSHRKSEIPIHAS